VPLPGEPSGLPVVVGRVALWPWVVGAATVEVGAWTLFGAVAFGVDPCGWV
jgi:hypothetical protein